MNKNGRTKGSVNRTTQQMRDLLLEAFGGEFTNIPYYLEQLTAREKLEVLCKMMPYLCPKVEAIGTGSGDREMMPAPIVIFTCEDMSMGHAIT
jgi:hypothetical protein